MGLLNFPYHTLGPILPSGVGEVKKSKSVAQSWASWNPRSISTVSSCLVAYNSLHNPLPFILPLGILHWGCIILGTADPYLCSQSRNWDLTLFPKFIQRTKPSVHYWNSPCCLPANFILYLPSGFLPCMLMVSHCAGYVPFPSWESYFLLLCSVPVWGGWLFMHCIPWAFLLAGFLYLHGSQSRVPISATSPSCEKQCHRVWLVAGTGRRPTYIQRE